VPPGPCSTAGWHWNLLRLPGSFAFQVLLSTPSPYLYRLGYGREMGNCEWGIGNGVMDHGVIGGYCRGRPCASPSVSILLTSLAGAGSPDPCPRPDRRSPLCWRGVFAKHSRREPDPCHILTAGLHFKTRFLWRSFAWYTLSSSQILLLPPLPKCGRSAAKVPHLGRSRSTPEATGVGLGVGLILHDPYPSLVHYDPCPIIPNLEYRIPSIESRIPNPEYRLSTIASPFPIQSPNIFWMGSGILVKASGDFPVEETAYYIG
jgi:hypothetical protein